MGDVRSLIEIDDADWVLLFGRGCCFESGQEWKMIDLHLCYTFRIQKYLRCGILCLLCPK